MIISLIIITGNFIITIFSYHGQLLTLIWSAYIFFSIKPDVFTEIIALFFTKPLLNHFLWHTMTSIYLNSKSYDPNRSSKVPLEQFYALMSRKSRTKKSKPKVGFGCRISVDLYSSSILLQTNAFKYVNFFVVLFFADLENSMTIYLFHLILIILDNINSFPNILFQASKFKFLTYHMLHMLKTYP